MNMENPLTAIVSETGTARYRALRVSLSNYVRFMGHPKTLSLIECRTANI